MPAFTKYIRVYPIAILAIFLLHIGAKMSQSQVPQRAETSIVSQPVTVIIWTDHEKYSLRDSVKLNASLRNTGDAPVYVDRRMFWTGLGGSLKLEITDEQGNTLSARVLSDAIMPPPKEGDTSILIRLDKGFFYGTGVNLLVKDFLPRAGKYSIRVVYKSWLRKEFVAPPLRELPAMWADSPEIASKPVWVEVTE